MTTELQTKGSVTAPETEITIYAKIGRPEGLKEADDCEEHEQIQARLTDSSRIRIRKTIKNGVASLSMTIKNDLKDTHEGLDATQETTIAIDEGFYQAFKEGASEVIQKTRYCFHSKNVTASIIDGTERKSITLPNVKYEVDVFHVDKHNSCVWCKIDIEVDAIEKFIRQNYADVKDIKLSIAVSHLPFKPTEMFMKEADMPQMHQSLLDDLWENYFTQKINSTEDVSPMTMEK
jgi:hypothetical protein